MNHKRALSHAQQFAVGTLLAGLAKENKLPAVAKVFQSQADWHKAELAKAELSAEKICTQGLPKPDASPAT